jgi:hypothetical protein
MTHRPPDPQKANSPGAAGLSAKTKTEDTGSIAPLSHDVNRDYDALRLALEAEEKARWALIQRNSTVRDRIFKYGLGKDGTLPKVNKLESSIGRMPFEFPFAAGCARVTPRTINGTLIGHDSESLVTLDSMREAFIKKMSKPQTRLEVCITLAEYRLNTVARRAEYTIDEVAIDRRYLFEGQFLFNTDELEKMLTPRYIKARFDYAARIHLTLHRLEITKPSQGGHMRNALFRVEEWARINSEQLPDRLRLIEGGAA